MKIINSSFLDSYDNKELVEYLYSDFIKNIPLKLDSLEKLNKESQRKEIQQLLHALSNHFGNIGAEVLAKYCQSYEERFRNNEEINLDEKIELLREQYVIAKSELIKIIKK